nr:glycosyltransferase [Azospirillum sp. 412522]
MTDTQTLDCIVRFHDVRRLAELERCVFSLVGQQYRPLHIHIVVQRFSDEERLATEAALAPMLRFPGAPRLTVHPWNEEGVVDARSHLLNHGIRVAQGRYLAFLDYDDLLFPEAYELLVGRLRTTGAAIAFASVEMMSVDVADGLFHMVGRAHAPFWGRTLLNLLEGNFCPIHSYVIDRSRVDDGILAIDPALTIEEDYDLLLRLCARHPSDFELIGTPIGYYVFKTDGSNTVGVSGGIDGEKLVVYKAVRKAMQSRKMSTPLSVEVQRTLGLPVPREGFTIHDALMYFDERNQLQNKLELIEL